MRNTVSWSRRRAARALAVVLAAARRRRHRQRRASPRSAARPDAHPGHPRRPRPGPGRGRGAAVGFLEQEAEKAVTNGTVIGPDRTAYTLPAEASGRSAVQLAPGQYVEFTLPKAANAITVRYSDPRRGHRRRHHRAARRHASTARHSGPMTLTSQYSWLYNQYPFTQRPERRPAAPRLVDHRVRVRAGGDDADADDHDAVPAHALLRRAAPAARQDVQGRRQGPADRPAGTNAAWTVIDLLDSELVGLPHVQLKAANVLLFGADPFGQQGLRRRVRQGHRVRAEAATCRSTCRRASTR